MRRKGTGIMPYDFKAARARIAELTGMYRLAKRSDDDAAQWAIMAQIDEIEREITAAHASGNGKMTVLADGHPVMHMENIIAPIIPAWSHDDKGAAT